jgi:hypothetical protein
LIAELAGEDLVRGGADRVRDIALQTTERGIRFRSRFLDQNRGGDEIGRGVQAADGEVLDGARGLDAVVRVSRNLELAKRIAFAPKARSPQPLALSPQP